MKAVKVKKKKTLAQKIAEKEEAAALAREERIAREEEEKQLNTPEGRILFIPFVIENRGAISLMFLCQLMLGL